MPISLGQQPAQPGRAAPTLSGKDSGPCFSIGIDLGGTNLRIAAYSGNAERLRAVSIRTRTEAGFDAVLQDIADAVLTIYAGCGQHGEFAGIGIGSPGPIELPAGRLIAPANLPGWHGLELKTELESRLQMRVIVESDANAAALAEWHLGAGAKYQSDSMAMLTLGTGVGGGLILNRRIWHGSMGMAAEPGHTVVYPQGLACNCGTHGCLEMYASATAVRRMAHEAAQLSSGHTLSTVIAEHGDIHAHQVAATARQGDAAAMEIFVVVGEALGIGLASLVGALNLSNHAIGGGLAQAWDLFAPAMFASMARHSQIYRMTRAEDPQVHDSARTNVFPAHLGPEAGILGAALLPHFK